MYVFMYVCLYVCLSVCLYVCMYVCMYLGLEVFFIPFVSLVGFQNLYVAKTTWCWPRHMWLNLMAWNLPVPLAKTPFAHGPETKKQHTPWCVGNPYKHNLAALYTECSNIIFSHIHHDLQTKEENWKCVWGHVVKTDAFLTFLSQTPTSVTHVPMGPVISFESAALSQTFCRVLHYKINCSRQHHATEG